MNTLRLLSFQALLAGTLATQQASQAFDGPPSTEQEDRTGLLLKQMEELTKSVNDLVNQLKNSETNKNLRAAVAQEEIEQLRREVARLQKELQDWRTRTPAPSSSLYPPPGPATGRLRLINSYSVPVSIIVNDLSYQLAPGTERLVEGLRPGPFTFEVLGMGYGSIKSRVSRTLAANETYTIQVEPQR
jgi:hypothetical protein